MHIFSASNSFNVGFTSFGQVLADVISGCILFVLGSAAKYMKRQAEQQEKLTDAFQLHIEEDKLNFQMLKKFAKDQRKFQRKLITRDHPSVP